MAGESLVNDLEGDSGIDTEVATFILDRFISDFQMRGLTSNTYVKKYNLTADGVIDLPTDTISAELTSYHTNNDGDTIRGLSREDKDGNIRLHNLTDHKNTWDKSKDYYVTIVYSMTWTEIETSIQRAIMAAAARQYQLVMQGDADMDSYLGNMETIYTAKGKAADIDDKNKSVFASLGFKARQILNRSNATNDPTRFRYWRSKQDG